MKVTRYKPLFSVSAVYELAGIGDITNGIFVTPVYISEERMTDLKLRPRYKYNEATVYYEGTEMPTTLPTTSEPVLEIVTDEYFYFGITLSQKEVIKKLKFHSTPQNAVEAGFPLLYDASIPSWGGATQVVMKDDVKLMQPIFTLKAPVSETAITAEYAAVEIRNEKNELVNLDINPVKVDTVTDEFVFSVDASKLQAGIYEFKVGNFKRKYFLVNNIDISELTCLIRVIKNQFLLYKKNLADLTFEKFELHLDAA